MEFMWSYKGMKGLYLQFYQHQLTYLIWLMKWNVQGLGTSRHRRYRGILRQELHKCLLGGQLDVLLIQEHHLCEKHIANYGTFLHG